MGANFMKKKLLIIEDDLALRYMLQRSLLNLEIDVIAADNGKVALEILRNDPSIILIVTDIRMPVMSGIEFRKEQLRDPSVSHVPIIFLTGHLSQVNPAQDLRPHLVLTKPVAPDDFRKIVENIIFS